ncbi:MAG: hypothetical protein WD715_00145 [Dongiaceae bacterium]
MMTATHMTLERLQALLDAYGADAAHWPAAERPAAERLLAAMPEAHAQHDEAARLDAMLDAMTLPTLRPLDTTILTARVLAMPQRDPLRHPVGWLVHTIGVDGPAAAGLALAAALAGFLIGWGDPEPAIADETLAALFPVSSSEVDQSW